MMTIYNSDYEKHAMGTLEIDALLDQAEKRLFSSKNVDMVQSSKSPSLIIPNHAASKKRPASNQALSVCHVPSTTSRTKSNDVENAGPKWFFMTSGLNIEKSKQQWKLLQMRGLLNPIQRKKAISSKLPQFTQIAQIMDDGMVLNTKSHVSVADFATIEDAFCTKVKASYHNIQRKKADGGKLSLRSRIQKKHGYIR